MKQKVLIRQFRVGNQGQLNYVESIETDVHVKDHFGPERNLCASYPFKEHIYHAIQYRGQWWQVNLTPSHQKENFELCLPSKSILDALDIE